MKRNFAILPALGLCLLLVSKAGADEGHAPVEDTFPSLALEVLIDQLGADNFALRKAAEEALAEWTRKQPEATEAALDKRLMTESDPEVQVRIKHLLRLVRSEWVPFTGDTVEAKQWQILGEAPEKASYEIDGDWLEIRSLEKVEEGMGFVHRFRGRIVGDARQRFRFGPPPRFEPERYVLDAEIKILKQQHVRKGLAGMHLNVEDDRTSAGLMIQEDGVFLYRHGKVHPMDTTNRFHHYRFVIEGARQWVFIDDMSKPVFEVERPAKAGRWWATLGDGTTGAGVHAQVRKAAFSRHQSDLGQR